MIRTGGEDVDCVGDIKDKELKLEEIETSHTLGGVGQVVRTSPGRGEGVDDTLLSYTLKYISLSDGGMICQVGFR